jgi:O-antigen/teichoic acid export membrane protein
MGGGLRKINQAFGPTFMTALARHMQLGQIADAQATFGAVARWMLTVLLPAVAVFGLAGGALMSIYGPAFVQGAAWLAIAGAASALNAFVGLGETILMVSRPRINFGNAVAAIAGGVASHLILIPRIGPLGAAISVLVPYAVYGLLRGAEITWLFAWQWPWIALAKPIGAALVALAPALAVRLSTHGLAMQLVSAGLYLATYVAAWRVIGLDASDRALLDHLLGRRSAAATIAGTSL